MRTHFMLVSAFMAATFLLAGCQTTPDKGADRTALHDDGKITLKRMIGEDPGLQEVLDNAHGYAIYPSVGKGGLIVGAAHGRGLVYEQGKFIGYSAIEQASIGLQAGGQEYSELVVFANEQAMNRMKNEGLSLGADATAVALKAGAAKAGNFRDGVMVFTEPRGGLMAGISVTGQRLTFERADRRNDRN